MSDILIYTSYSPNTREKDLKMSWSLLGNYSLWYEGDSSEQINKYFAQYYPNSKSYTFNHARSAMFMLFKELFNEDQDKNEIIFQGFTCAAASLPAIWAGYKPIYVDIEEESLSVSFKDLQNALSDQTKAIVVQYTLGLSPDIELIRRLAKEYGILVIEDCTHYLPTQKEEILGHYGDFSVFSFGRDKVVSGIDGGVLLVNNKKYFDIIDHSYGKLQQPSTSWLLKRLLFPIFWDYIKRFYNTMEIGKLIHLFLTNVGLLTKATSKQEKAGIRPEHIPSLLPNSLAKLAMTQLDDLVEIQNHRIEISKIYQDRLKGHPRFTTFTDMKMAPLRFPILYKYRDEVLSTMKEKNIMLGDWYSQPVSPDAVNFSVSMYEPGSCKVSEEVCSKIFNLPTHINITKEDANFLIDQLINFDKNMEDKK